MALLMGRWFARWAGWLASGLFLATIFYLALVAVFALTPMVDIRLVLGGK
jgi:membrane-anchored glycerophosphoryl diester phosphodiesterase (GDPDase)